MLARDDVLRRSGLLARVDAEATQGSAGLVKGGGRNERAHAQNEVIVHCVVEAQVEVAHPLMQRAAPEHRLRIAEKSFRDQALAGIGQTQKALHNSIVSVDRVPVAVDDLYLGAAAEDFGGMRECPRQIDVVAVEPAEYLTGRAAKSLVECIALAAIRLARPMSQILTPFLEERLCPILRTPIDNDKLGPGKILIEHGQNATSDISSLAVRRHHDRKSQVRFAAFALPVHICRSTRVYEVCYRV